MTAIMVALKAAEIETFVARPHPARPVVLVFGPDAGLVRERVDKIVLASVDDPRDPFALVHLDGDLLASEPSRLAEEAHTVPLFGGRRAVLVKAGSRNFAAAVEAVLAVPPADCRIVIEAGDLRRNAPLRALCEKAKNAAAIPCYVDGERELARLVDDEMREAKLAIAPDARAALVSLIGGDRQASRSEIRKLALYAHGQASIVLDDVLAVVADASALALDAVVDAAFAGKTAEAETHFSKALAAGTSAGTILSSALRHATQLHKARLAIDAGEHADAALGVFVPPLHFRRRSLVEAALKIWAAPRLQRVMEQLADATRDVRQLRAPADGLAEPLAQRAVLSIAISARRVRRDATGDSR
jgi:DNA polymerase-3 subunit delta